MRGLKDPAFLVPHIHRGDTERNLPQLNTCSREVVKNSPTPVSKRPSQEPSGRSLPPPDGVETVEGMGSIKIFGQTADEAINCSLELLGKPMPGFPCTGSGD